MASMVAAPSMPQSAHLHARPEAPSSPRMILQYEVLQTLGSGLQGKVKLGLDTTTNERVALKLIDSSELNRKSLLNVYREVEAMGRVRHPNVLRLSAVHDDVVYPKKDGTRRPVILIVLELATGGELFDYMMYTGCFSEDVARTYFRQLVSGLSACHRMGVYHRDIKPENLLMDADFTLKIADFGLSGLREGPDGAITELYTQCGTRSYMSPEVLSGYPYEGEPADVWSAGVVLFIMLAGFPPFQMATKQDWWFRACAAKKHQAFWAAHQRSAVFSDGAMNLLTRVFQTSPEDRITLDEMKDHPWFQQGSDVSGAVFRDELIRRKMQVEHEKCREKEEKMQQQKHVSGEEYDPFDRDVSRFVSSHEEETEYMEQAPECPRECVYVHTQFDTKHTPAEVQTRLEQALNELDVTFTTNKDACKIKATDASTDVAIAVQIYYRPSGHGWRVECRRTRGDCLEYRKLYKALSDAVADLIWIDAESDGDDDTTDSFAEELISDEARMI